MKPDQKHILNLSYTKARIKPFLNPLFLGSSLIASVFFYGLWQYTTNPNLFVRDNAGPEITRNEPETTSPTSTLPNIEQQQQQLQQATPIQQTPLENNTEDEPLTTEDLAILADIDNIGSLFQEVELNPLLTPKKRKSKSNNNSQNNIFQDVAESDNLLGINKLDVNSSDSVTPKIEVIKPNVELPSLQDLLVRQRTAVQQDPLKQAIQNTAPIFSNSQVIPNQYNGANNSNSANNTNPSNNVNGINSNSNYSNPNSTNIQTNPPNTLGYNNPYTTTVPTTTPNTLGYNNPYTITAPTTTPQINNVPTIEQNNNNLSGFSQGTNNNSANIQTNPYQTNPYQTNPYQTNPYQNNNFNNNLGNNNFNNQNQQNQQPTRQRSKVLYYY